MKDKGQSDPDVDLGDELEPKAKAKAKAKAHKPKRSRWLLRGWLLAVMGFSGCAALGYYYWELRTEKLAQEELLTQRTADEAACRDDRQAVQAKADTCSAALTTCDSDKNSCETTRAAKTTKLDDLARAQKKMEEDLHATASELESLRELKAEAERGAAAFADLKQQLKEMIDSKQLEVQQRDGRMIVQLSAEVLFASGSAELSEDGKVALIKLSAVLERMPERRFMVAGHTDAYRPAKGSAFASNWELSTARAVTVTELLVTAKIPPENLVAAGYGEFAPIADNADEKGRKLNRRIEIVLLPDFERLTLEGDAATEDGS